MLFHEFGFERNAAGQLLVTMDGKPLKGVVEVETTAKAPERYAYVTIKFATPIIDKNYVDKTFEQQTLVEKDQ